MGDTAEQMAKSHGITRAAYATIAPTSPLALDRPGVGLSHITLIDMHEAFTAQTLCNLQCFGDERFAREKLNRPHALGEVDEARFNVLGGSITYGHLVILSPLPARA